MSNKINNLQKQLFEHFNKQIKSEVSFEEMFKMLTASLKEEIPEVDFKNLKELFLCLHQLQNESRTYKDDKDFKTVFQNTLNLFDIDLSNSTLINALEYLGQADIIIIVDEVEVLARLYSLLLILDEHIEALSLYKKLSKLAPIEGGVALYSNSNIDDLIEPRLNALNEVLHLDKENNGVKNIIKILNMFKEDKSAMDFSLYALQFIARENIDTVNLDEELLNLLFEIREFLNASSNLDKQSFYKSAQIYALNQYNKVNIFQELGAFEIELSQIKIIKALNVIMEHYIKMPSSKIYNACFHKKTQIKSSFFDLALLEYRTPKNIKPHPVLENEKELKDMVRTIL